MRCILVKISFFSKSFLGVKPWFLIDAFTFACASSKGDLQFFILTNIRAESDIPVADQDAAKVLL